MARTKKSASTSRGRTTGGKGLQIKHVRKQVKIAKENAPKPQTVVNLVDNDAGVGNSGEASTSGPQIYKGDATCSICGIDVKRYYEAQYCKHPVCKDCLSPNSMLLLCQDNYCSVVAKDLKDWKKEFDASQAVEVIDVDADSGAKIDKNQDQDADPDADTDPDKTLIEDEVDVFSGTPTRGRGRGRGSRGGRGGFSMVPRGRGSSQPAKRGGSVGAPASPKRAASVPRKRSSAQKEEGPVSFKCEECKRTNFVVNVLHCGRKVCNKCFKNFGSQVMSCCGNCELCNLRGTLSTQAVEDMFKEKRTKSYALKDAIVENRKRQAKTVHLCSGCHENCEDVSKLGCVHFLCRECWSDSQKLLTSLPEFGQPTTVKCQGTCPQEEEMKYREALGPVIDPGPDFEEKRKHYAEQDEVYQTPENDEHTPMYSSESRRSKLAVIFQSPGSKSLAQVGQRSYFLYGYLLPEPIVQARTALRMLSERKETYYSIPDDQLQTEGCDSISDAYMLRPLDFANDITDERSGLTFGCVYTIIFKSQFRPPKLPQGKPNERNEGFIVMLAPDIDLPPHVFSKRCLQMGAALSLNNMFFFLKHGGVAHDEHLQGCLAPLQEDYESLTGTENLIRLLKQHRNENLRYRSAIDNFFVSLPMTSIYHAKLEIFCTQLYDGICFSERRFCRLRYFFDGHGGLYARAISENDEGKNMGGDECDTGVDDYDHTLDFGDNIYSEESDGTREGSLIEVTDDGNRLTAPMLDADSRQLDSVPNTELQTEEAIFKISWDDILTDDNVSSDIENHRLRWEARVEHMLNMKYPEVCQFSDIIEDTPDDLYELHMEIRSRYKRIGAQVSDFCIKHDQTVASGGKVESSKAEQPESGWFSGEAGDENEDDPLMLRTVPVESPTLNLLDHPEVKRWLFGKDVRVKFINHCGMTNRIEAPDANYGNLSMKFTSVLPLITENGKLKSLLELVKKPIQGISDIMSGDELHQLMLNRISVVKNNRRQNYPLTLLAKGTVFEEDVQWFTKKCFYPDQFASADTVLYVLRTIGMVYMDRLGLPKFYSNLLCLKNHNEYFALTETVAVNCKSYDIGFVPTRRYIDLHLQRFPKAYAFYTMINHENLHFFLVCVLVKKDLNEPITVIMTDSAVECVPELKRREYVASIEKELRKEFEGRNYKFVFRPFQQCHCNCGFFCILRILQCSFQVYLENLNPVEELHNKHFRETLSCVLCAQLMCLVPVYGIDEYPLPDEVASKIPEISFPFVRRPV